MVTLGNSKNVFWEALLLTIVVFVIGLLLGISYETSKYSEINQYYSRSELALMDSFALSNLIQLQGISCDDLKKENVDFANRIYNEAVLLEDYEVAGKITGEIQLAHKKYDLLRTLLWINLAKTREKCNDFNSVIYLYEYNTKDIQKKAVQNVWSKVLYDLKQNSSDDLILIPIAADNGISSLDLMNSKFNITSYPVVIVNDEEILYQLSSKDEIETFLK